MSKRKNIQVDLAESEIVSISRTKFEDKKHHIAIIDFHIECLCFNHKMSGFDLDKIRNILKNIKL